MSAQPLLDVRQLTVAFGGKRVVHGVDFHIAAGEKLALVGESGSGKTTLARTLMGLERPASGQVLFDGEPLDYAPRRMRGFRSQVQMVLQDAAGSLNPRQSVYESVAEGIRLHKRVATDPDGRSEVQLVAAALAEARATLLVGQWWLTVLPGICISVVVLAANLFGDWLRVKLDPQQRNL